MISALMLTAFLGTANASIDPDCQAVADAGPPADYSEQGQADFLLNYFALATTFSPLHAPVPDDPGHGSISVEGMIIPPLGCERRLVLNYTKTEDTNKAPVAPRFRATFAFPQVGKVVPYAGLGYTPPVTVGKKADGIGLRNVIVSGEAGFGIPLDSGLQVGGRYHFTLMKSIAEIASPFEEGGTPYADFYMGSTFGGDVMAGWELMDGAVTPYVAAGVTDASTFFFIGDDNYVGNNMTPYFGFTGSVGAAGTVWDWLALAGEFYTAPGYIYTGRLSAGYAF